MADSDPYSRHYWRLVDDPKFAEIFDDDHHYATWSRLLMLADQAWPASAHVPISVRRASLSKLSEVGLIDLLPKGRFKMHGLDYERRKRAEHAKVAAAVRWGSNGHLVSIAPRSAPSNAQTMPSKEEQSREEKMRSQQRDERLWKERGEWFRETGAWDEAWGPKPA